MLEFVIYPRRKIKLKVLLITISTSRPWVIQEVTSTLFVKLLQQTIAGEVVAIFGRFYHLYLMLCPNYFCIP